MNMTSWKRRSRISSVPARGSRKAQGRSEGRAVSPFADKYGDDRKTEIQDVEDEIDMEDLIAEEECVFTLSHNGYIKRTPAAEYRAQSRGGKGVRGMATREEDYVESVFTASTHDFLLFFSSRGQVYVRKGYQIPEAGRSARGTNIVNILPLEPEEKISAMLTRQGPAGGRFHHVLHEERRHEAHVAARAAQCPQKRHPRARHPRGRRARHRRSRRTAARSCSS